MRERDKARVVGKNNKKDVNERREVVKRKGNEGQE